MLPAFKNTGVDFGKAATDYATHRTGFPPGFYGRLKSYFGLLQTPSTVIDIGAGTGTIARYLAREGHHVSALDPSPEMLDQCRRLEAETHSDPGTVRQPITYYPGATAEDTGIPGTDCFDYVFAGQCWHWFDAPRALAEVRRLLAKKPESRLIICHFDWLLLPGTVGLRTSDLISKYNPRWHDMIAHSLTGAGTYPQWTVPLYEAGFSDMESFSFIEKVPYTHEAWRGRVRASAGIRAGGLSEKQVREFDDELRAELGAHPDPVLIPHRCFAYVCKPSIS
jgi:SAM-dependent methyltransferase